MSGGDEESSSEKLFPQEQLAAIIGDENIHHCPTLIHLVVKDSAYTDEQTNIKEGKLISHMQRLVHIRSTNSKNIICRCRFW